MTLLTFLKHGIAPTLLLAVLAWSPAAPARAAERKTHPITEAANQALWTGDFDELERQNAALRKPGRLEPDGTLQLDLFRRGIDAVLNNQTDDEERYLLEVDRLTLQWAQAHPSSALAHVLHARALTVHAWFYRGGSFAKNVPPDAWKDFEAYLRRAAEYLNAHADVAFTDSYAHYALLEIGRGLSWRPEQLIAIADDGLKRNPDDTELMFSVARSLLPKWLGNARLLDAYVNHAVQQSRERFGSGMYARLYAMTAINQYEYGLFEESRAEWPRVRQGYDDLLARFPDSSFQLNRYAYMACIAKDGKTLADLLKRIGDAVDSDAWGSSPQRELTACRRLAAGQ